LGFVLEKSLRILVRYLCGHGRGQLFQPTAILRHDLAVTLPAAFDPGVRNEQEAIWCASNFFENSVALLWRVLGGVTATVSGMQGIKTVGVKPGNKVRKRFCPLGPWLEPRTAGPLLRPALPAAVKFMPFETERRLLARATTMAGCDFWRGVRGGFVHRLSSGVAF
jgi:hypothetical protein